MRAVLAAAVAGLLAVAPCVARADEKPDDVRPYALRAPRDGVRVTLEEIGLLGAGFLQYLQTASNSSDWDLDYSWGSLGKKLAGGAIAFDTNRFDTNWVTHPVAGLLYYSAARGNRLSIAESFLVALASSTVWEYLGEFREQVSINDMVVTPVGGLILGEALFQLGSFFDRGHRTPTREALAWFFGAPAKVHDALDGITVQEADEGGHDLRVGVGVGATTQAAGTSVDTRVALSSRLVAANGYERRGRIRRWLGDGNVSSIAFSGTVSGGEPVDAAFAARISLAAHLDQSLWRRPSGLYGHTTLTTIGLGFTYDFHEWDRAHGGATDRIAALELFTLGVDQSLHLGPAKLRWSVAASACFASPTTLVRDDWLAQHSRSGVPTVVMDQGYGYSFGGRVSPTLELDVGPFVAHGEATMYSGQSIAGFDRTKMGDYLYFHDRVASAGGGIGARLGAFAFDLNVHRRARASTVQELTREYEETSFGADAMIVY